MEDGDESAAAALGLSPQLFVNEVHGIIADISAEAFEYCLQLRSSLLNSLSLYLESLRVI
jgi:hypothetical protein